MVCCFAPGCSHRSSHETCSFYRFPANVFQRRVWIRAMRRADRKPNTLTTTTLQRDTLPPAQRKTLPDHLEMPPTILIGRATNLTHGPASGLQW
ncbi:uncharacterized protein LOC117559081 isoform X2 [Gymnodraco acuticeps]|uniref:Uncharacterized protein LOC117559081 isoform X2 n=1 Tax=Gymnodraco acuticeps TaxID=8218 RepID=A0A6P8VLX4_GYMAC|nr:uncharacterized protein LOC117559081 isoform X2 [Gymnodraco acuticeps]